MSRTEKRRRVTSALGCAVRCCMVRQQTGTVDPQGEGSGTQKKTGKLPEQLDQAHAFAGRHSLLTHEHRDAALVAEAVGPESVLAVAQIATAAAAAAVAAEETSADSCPDKIAHGRGDHKASAWVETQTHQQHAVLETAWVGT